MHCLDENLVVDLLQSSLPSAERAAIEIHLDDCASCRRMVSAASRAMLSASSDDQSGESVPTLAEGSAAVRGLYLGKYVLLERLGAGGMGVVYAAYDPSLDRKVALKVLRAEVAWRRGDEVARERLLKEARAMGRLAHPNVVVIYETGAVGEQLYLAMEHVDGVTLDQWLAESRRSWREVLDVFLEAGRGLSAAHEAKLVHRDFKPSNVLVGRDGRARVTDFGLATLLSAAEPVVTGTPGYMAPEQRAGRPADPRSDQYSFCLCLDQALRGEQGTSRVPRRIRRVLARGMATDPAARHPSMEHLLRRLRRRSGRHVRWGLALAAVVALSLGGAAAYTRHRSQLCHGGEKKLAGVWDDARRRTVREALSHLKAPFAADAWLGVERVLDDYARRWTAMYTETCEATRVWGDQSERVMELRMGCLDRRLQEIQELTAVLAKADDSMARGAVRAALGLTDLAVCSDVGALEAPLALPDDPAAREQVESVQRSLAQGKALMNAGVLKPARETAEAAAAEARAIDYPPIRAQAVRLLAETSWRSRDAAAAEPLLLEAVFAAEEGHDDETGVRASTNLVHVLGFELARPAEARIWARHAKAILTRMGRRPDLEMQLVNSLGNTHYRAGEFEEAVRHYRRAVELAGSLAVPDDREIAKMLGNSASALTALGRYPEALEQRQRQLEIYGRRLGRHHPDYGDAVENLAIILQQMGKLEDARARHQEALDILIGIHGEDYVEVATILVNLAAMAGNEGQLEAAVAHIDRALAIRTRVLGPEHPDVANAMSVRGDILIVLGRGEEAGDASRRAIALLEKAFGPDHVDLAGPLRNLSQLASAEGRFAEAQALAERSLVVAEKAVGREHPQLAPMLIVLARAQIGSGRHAEAIPVLERAVALAEKSGATQDLAQARQMLDASRGPASRGNAAYRPIRRRQAASDGTRR